MGGMAKRRGNPNWGKATSSEMKWAPEKPTQFELEVARLKLPEREIVFSDSLRRWAKRNAHRRYVPEALLQAWGIIVDDINVSASLE